LGDGNAVDLGKQNPGLIQRPLDHRQEVFQMPPGRDFGHHPAVLSMQLKLGGHDGR